MGLFLLQSLILVTELDSLECWKFLPAVLHEYSKIILRQPAIGIPTQHKTQAVYHVWVLLMLVVEGNVICNIFQTLPPAAWSKRRKRSHAIAAVRRWHP